MGTNDRRSGLIQRLGEIAANLSGVPRENLPEGATFLELGFDSLFLTQFSTACQKEFGTRITFRQLFSDLPTIAALGSYLDEKLPLKHVVIVSAGKQNPAPAIETTPTLSAAPAHSATPASVPRCTPAEAQAVIDTTIPLPFPLAVDEGAVPIAGMESLLVRQLDLMTAQLRLLQSLPMPAAVPVDAKPGSGATLLAQPHDPTPTRADAAGAAAAQNAVPPTEQQTTEAKEVGTSKQSSGFGPGVVTSTALPSLPGRQQQHLDTLIKNYTRKTVGSKERTQRYRRRLADPRTAAGFNRRWKEMVYPIWVQRSLGSKLWDVDGNVYIDILNGFGPNFFGHSPEFITKAIQEQLSQGFEIGPQTPLVGEVAEMICQLTGMDRASFTCSGSEAVQAAMRLSRTVTGRDKVVVFSRDYHGNFDQVLVREANRQGQFRTMPSAPGIPFRSVDDTYVMEYGTTDALEQIKKHADDIAAVLVEPVQSRRPELQPREFLRDLRRVTREAGIVLVFDEVVTGFRCAPGGAQAYFGVEADIATYGKVIGGGMPIGVVAGRATIMDTFDGGFWQYGDGSFPEAGVTFFAGTFVRHPLAMAAAHASLKYLIEQGPALQKRVSDKAARFAGQLNELFKKYELEIELPRFSSQMYLRIKDHSELANLLAFHLRYRGVHLLEGFPCYLTDAHTDEDVDHLVRAFTESVEAMVEDGIFANSSKLSKLTDTDAKRYSTPAICISGTQQSITSQGHIRSAEHPSTDLQKEMWIAAQIRAEASAASNGTNIVELSGEVNIAALEWAISEVASRHEALRSTFSEDGSKVVVRPSISIELHCHDLSSFSSIDAAVRLTEILEEDGRQVFDLVSGPLVSFQLIKLSPSKYVLVFTAQMIICDGWGFKVVLEEISAVYSAFVQKRELSLESPKQMRDYASWQAQERDSAWAKECERFWLAQFETIPSPFELPSSGPRPPTRSYDAARANLRLAPEFYQGIKRVARDLRNTPFALLLTAYAVWLCRLGGREDVVIGVPFAGQGALGLNTLVGQCVHTLPFLIRCDRAAAFVDQLNLTRQFILDAQEHWNSSYSTLVQKLNISSDPSRIPLVPVIFNLDPTLSEVQFSGCASRITSGPRFYFHYDLGFNLVEEDETLLVECDYNTNLFDSDTIRDWIGEFQRLLESIVSNPSEKLGGLLPVSPEAQSHQKCLQVKRQSRPLSLASHGASKIEEEYIAPRNDTEKRLARLWCETLKLNRVGSRANFFDLGGHSLAAGSLFAKIEEEFGRKLPLATLLTAPTIEGLSMALQGGTTENSWSPLVPIQPSGSKPPLFLVHGAGGNVLLYRSLGEHLAPEYPLYGFQSKGLDGRSRPLHTIQEMAACYLRELRTVQPVGPYYLGGYCLGGTIAYEMAQILRREGEEVALVAMLDTYNYSRALKVSFHSFLFQKAKFHLANISRMRPGTMIGYLQEKIRLGFGGELANLKTSMPGASRADGISRAMSGIEARVQAINDYAAEHYSPLPYAGRLTLFKPRFNYKFYPDPKMGWGNVTMGGLDMVEVAVNPHSMLVEPYVKILAAQLKERIAGMSPVTINAAGGASSLMEHAEVSVLGD